MFLSRRTSIVVNLLLGLAVLVTPSVVTLHYCLLHDVCTEDAISVVRACDEFGVPCGVSSKADPTRTLAKTVCDPTAADGIDVSLPAAAAAFADALSIVSFSAQDHSLQQLGVRLQV